MNSVFLAMRVLNGEGASEAEISVKAIRFDALVAIVVSLVWVVVFVVADVV